MYVLWKSTATKKGGGKLTFKIHYLSPMAVITIYVITVLQLVFVLGIVQMFK